MKDVNYLIRDLDIIRVILENSKDAAEADFIRIDRLQKYIRESALSAPEVGKWQDISTAPVDVWILAYDTDHARVARKIDNGVGTPKWSDLRGIQTWFRPTHWMPLPESPKP